VNFGKCSQRSCPFPSDGQEGEVLCSQHRRFFAYEISMEDRSIDLNSPERGGPTVEGLTIHVRRHSARDKGELLLNSYHRILGSAAIIKDVYSFIDDAPLSQRGEWQSNHFAAQEVFEAARYKNKPFCCVCGCEDLYRFHVGMRTLWKCKLCRFEFSVMRHTIMHDSHILLNTWVQILLAARGSQSNGCIREIAALAGVCYGTAWRVNYLVHLSGKYLGMNLGYRGKSNNQIVNQLTEKLGLTNSNGRELGRAPVVTSSGDGS
jgi:hypothetical protein